MLSGIEHSWRLTPEGLQLEPIPKPKSHTNVFASRALCAFQSAYPPVAKPQAAGGLSGQGVVVRLGTRRCLKAR